MNRIMGTMIMGTMIMGTMTDMPTTTTIRAMNTMKTWKRASTSPIRIRKANR